MKRALLVAMCVVVAGCSTLSGGDVSSAPATGTPADTTGLPTPSTESPTQTTPTATQRPTTTFDRTTVERSADNPWNDDTVTVALVTDGHDEIDYGSALADAIEYWNHNMRYAEYAVDLRVVEPDREADVRLEIDDTIEDCSFQHDRDVLGCAPKIERGDSVDPPATVTVKAGYNVESTTDIFIHELGHVLGIGHGQPPTEYMSPTETAFRTPQPNASERAYPWETTTFSVYADLDQLPSDEREAVREQIDHVLTYYRQHADAVDGVPDNLTVEWVEDPDEATVEVRFPPELPTGDGSGAGLKRAGYDTDGDGAVEHYANATIWISELDTAATGWHTGHWFGRGLGLAEHELPEPLDDASPEERRSDWWTEPPN